MGGGAWQMNSGLVQVNCSFYFLIRHRKKKLRCSSILSVVALPNTNNALLSTNWCSMNLLMSLILCRLLLSWITHSLEITVTLISDPLVLTQYTSPANHHNRGSKTYCFPRYRIENHFLSQGCCNTEILHAYTYEHTY